MIMCERLLSNPNLPENKVKKVIIAPGNKKLEQSLNDLGIETITITRRTNVRQEIRHHSDLYFCQLDSKNVVVSSQQGNLIKKLQEDNICNNIIVEEKILTKDYPGDVLLNCAFFDKYVIYNDKTVSDKINAYINGSDLTKICVKQGYTKCSVSIVSNNAILTDDEFISKKVIGYGIDALLIKKGYVKLKGFEYGFIGGCCGKIDKNTLAFNGDITKHPEYIMIKQFLNKHGVNDLSLHNGELEDIGSIIPLTEES